MTMVLLRHVLHVFTPKVEGQGASRRIVGWSCKNCGQTFVELPPVQGRGGCTRGGR